MNISKEKLSATIDLLTVMVAEEIAQRDNISTEQALILFLTSPTAAILYGDEESKLWWEGPADIAAHSQPRPPL